MVKGYRWTETFGQISIRKRDFLLFYFIFYYYYYYFTLEPRDKSK